MGSEREFRKRVEYSRKKKTVTNSLDSCLFWAEAELDRLQFELAENPTPATHNYIQFFISIIGKCKSRESMRQVIELIETLSDSEVLEVKPDEWVMLSRAVTERILLNDI